MQFGPANWPSTRATVPHCDTELMEAYSQCSSYDVLIPALSQLPIEVHAGSSTVGAP